MSGSMIRHDFTRYSNLLSQCYDKHEKIYKLSRDLTRESKKIICTLHRLPGTSTEEQCFLITEAGTLLAKLRDGIISDIANLLLGEPFHLFTQAFSGGMEEYIEALQFFSFLKCGSVLDYNETCQYLLCSPGLRIYGTGNTEAILKINSLNTVTRQRPKEHVKETVLCCPVCNRREDRSEKEFIYCRDGSTPATGSSTVDDVAEPSAKEAPVTSNQVLCPHQSSLQLIPYDVFILGLSDVSGELMRYCIKSVAVGELESKDRVVSCLRQMKAGYVALGPSISKYLANKVYVHERNLSKVENVNYDLQLRGTELTPDQLRDDLQRRPAPNEEEESAPLFP